MIKMPKSYKQIGNEKLSNKYLINACEFKKFFFHSFEICFEIIKIVHYEFSMFLYLDSMSRSMIFRSIHGRS